MKPELPTFSTNPAVRGRRYHEFDALRGFAMLLGILLHGMLSFMVVPFWPVQDVRQNWPGGETLFHAIHGFRMPLFFLISGFFTAMMWRKYGAKGLVIRRLKRILVPLVVVAALMWPMMVFLQRWGREAMAERTPVLDASDALPRAAKAGDIKGALAALQAGADVNGRDRMGVSPIEWAAIRGDEPMISLLAERGADLNGRNPLGATPLHAAACFGHPGAVRRLVELGADPFAANARGDRPVDAARVDVGVVRYFAGLLGVTLDENGLAERRRAAADYLAALDPASAGAEVTSGAPRAGWRSVWNSAWSLYTTLAFLPILHHLWFLNYLLWLLGLFLVAGWVWRRTALRLPAWAVSTPWCLGWLLPLTFVPQWFMTQTFGPDTAPGILPWPPKLAYYAVFFGFGALCHGRPEFERRAGRWWPVWLAAAAVVLPLGLRQLQVGGSGASARVMTTTAAVLYAWLSVFGLGGLFRWAFAREHPVFRYLADASYWMYLVHLPLVIALQIVVGGWQMPLALKLLLVCGVSFALLLLSYHLCVRHGRVGLWLHGRNKATGVRWAAPLKPTSSGLAE